ncbi:unnamed protein product [Amoebophrya sp. A25]|nr:unnamed protein product [Amoebophrya sp. A25]|eukprot:GSA25T00019432001.1
MVVFGFGSKVNMNPKGGGSSEDPVWEARLQDETSFLERVNADEPEWHKMSTHFPSVSKYCLSLQCNIVAEAVSDCKNTRPVAEFRVSEEADSAGFFVVSRVGDSGGSLKNWFQAILDSKEFFLRETSSGEIWLITGVKRAADEVKHVYKVGEELAVVQDFTAKDIGGSKVQVTKANVQEDNCRVGTVDAAGKVAMIIVDVNGDSKYLMVTADIRDKCLQPAVSPLWVRAKGPPGCRDGSLVRSYQNAMELGERYEVLTLAKDYLARFCATLRVSREDNVSKELLNAVLQPQDQAEGSCEISRVYDGDFPVNAEQEALVTELGHNRITVAQGPPGTGKSTTIYHVVNSLGQEDPGAAVMVTCVTNTAINSIMEKLEKCEGKGVNSLVLGNSERVGVNAKRFLLEAKVERDYAIEKTKNVRALFEGTWVKPRAQHDLEEEKAQEAMPFFSYRLMPFDLDAKKVTALKHAYNFMVDAVGQDVRELGGPTHALEKVMCELDEHRRPEATLKNNVLEEALTNVDRLCEWARQSAAGRIVAKTTCFLFTISSGYRMQQLQSEYSAMMPHTKLAVLDEAGATAESYVPMILTTGVENLLLLGDTKQLRPLVKGSPPDDFQIDRSLMERCCDAGADQQMLKEQYRMPPGISDVVSKLFYNGKLRTGANKKREAEALGAKKVAAQLRWLDVESKYGGSEEVKVGTSWCNGEQAIVAIAEALHIWKAAATQKKSPAVIFIICMYKPQVNLINRAIEKNSALASTLGADPDHVRVLSVDACQGSEADYVILVTSRSNSYGNIGFCSNPNRCNVAISRAKEMLTIVGDANCMCTGSAAMWGKVAKASSLESSKDCFMKLEKAYPSALGSVRETVELELERMKASCSKGASKGGAKGKGKRSGKSSGRTFGALFKFNK